MDEKVRKVNWPLGVVGAVLGGVAGYFVFFWIVGQGFYALILPGATVGLGCGALSRGRSHALGVVCGLLAVLVGLLAEWRLAPFAADESLGYFLKHLHQLQPITIIMIAVGAVLAYWMGMGRAGSRCEYRMDDKAKPFAESEQQRMTEPLDRRNSRLFRVDAAAERPVSKLLAWIVAGVLFSASSCHRHGHVDRNGWAY